MDHQKTNPVILIGAGVALFVAFNILLGAIIGTARLDLTSNKIYTLSDGTRNILSNLDDKIRIRYFYSEEIGGNIPAIQSYASRVSSFLKQYAALSGGKIELEFINPDPFSDAEDKAVSFGIQAVPVNNPGTKLYFGLTATNQVDDIEKIPFLDPKREAFLEYDLTKMIYTLSTPKKPVVGILNWLDKNAPILPFEQNKEEWFALKQIEEQFDVKELETNVSEIPADLDTLVIIHPTEISQDTEYAIDQFILRGGKAMIFVDPHIEIMTEENKTSDLPTLFKEWGVGYDKNFVALDRQNAMRIQSRDPQSRLQVMDKLNWLHLKTANMNSQDMVTAELNQLRIISGGMFKPQNKEGINFTPLLQTSDISSKAYNLLVKEPLTLLRTFKSSNVQETLALRMQGTINTAFPDKTNDGHIATSQKPANVIIVGDVDMLRDQFWVQKQNLFGHTLLNKQADNGAFIANGVENLSGSDALIGLRSRGQIDRPFIVVDELRRSAEERYLQKEQELQQNLRETERKLNDMQKGRNEGGSLVLSPAQEREVAKFRAQMVDTRKQLRRVRHSLQQEIESLGSRLKFIHIGLLPILIVLLGLFIPRHLGIKRA